MLRSPPAVGYSWVMPQAQRPQPDALERITEALDALQCGASVVDRSGKMVFINRRLAKMYGRPREQMIGRHIAEMYSDEQVRQQLGRMLEHFDDEVEGEFIIERADGSHLPIATAARPLRDDGAGLDLRIVTMIDVTRLKEMSDEVNRLNDMVIAQALDLKRHSEVLEQKVRERTAELREANMASIYMLAVASEARDEDTGAHVRRLQRYAQAVAERMGLPATEAEEIGYSAILHDVGKIHVPDAVLKKPGKLTDTEREQMQRHTVIGEAIIADDAFFAMSRQIARHHHENWDGSGYPDGLTGDTIELPARIVHVVDVFDALVSPRVYKDPWPPDRAIDAIRHGAGTQFDPAVVEAFVALCKAGEIKRIADELA